MSAPMMKCGSAVEAKRPAGPQALSGPQSKRFKSSDADHPNYSQPAKRGWKPRLGHGKKSGSDLQDIEELGKMFQPNQLKELRVALLEWYDSNHRILPWRRNPHSKVVQNSDEEQGTPLDMGVQQFVYRVWVCELMSQQTQVSRAAEYWKRWMEKWPTVTDLAKATTEEVNDMWAGLGYYRRARYLKDGAQHVMQKMNGLFPTKSAALQRIPGIGPYTGAAMASIAFGEPVAAVDGNVMRVLARLRCLEWDVKEPKRFQGLGSLLLDPGRAGDFNQAMMELGATVCTPAAPRCASCPIRQHCYAYQRRQDHLDAGGDPAAAPSVTQFPPKAEKTKKREETAAVCIVQIVQPPSQESKYLLVRRPKDGLLAGLWEFPSLLVEGDSLPAENRKEIDGYLTESLNLPVGGNSCKMAEVAKEGELPTGPLTQLARTSLGTVSHTFSHIQLTMLVEKLLLKGQVSLERREEEDGDLPAFKWVAEEELMSQPLSSGVKKVLDLMNKQAASSSTAGPKAKSQTYFRRR